MSVAGIILAGGLSRRMGGGDKSLLMLHDKEPIRWVAKAITPQVDHLAINANGDPQRFSFLELPVIPDSVEGFVGPLAGVLAAMQWAAQLEGVTHVVTAAADTPFIPHDLVSRLTAKSESDDDIIMAQSVGRIHPVFARWPIHLADDLEKFLVIEDKRKILEFARRYALHIVNFDKPGSDPFFNINTPEDLEIATQMATKLSNG